MGLTQLISSIIEEELATSDHFLVGYNVNEAETDLRFFIDGEVGVSVQVCTKLSRKISRILDEEYMDETPIRFEISSPGVDRPLIDKRQYAQHIGRELEIVLDDQNEKEGTLLEVNEDSITIESIVSKHKKESQTIEFDQIKNSTVKISFKRKKK